MDKRQDFINKDFEYFNMDINPVSGKTVIDIQDDTVVILEPGHFRNTVQINQLDIFAKSATDYHTIVLERQAIIDLAEYLKNN